MALVFGLVPHVDDEAMRTAMAGLETRLTEETGLAVKLRSFSSPMGLAIALGAGEVDVAWTSPTLLFEEQLGGVDPILSVVREGVATYHAVLFVAEGSRFQRPEDLAGATVAWVAKTSAAGWKVPRLALSRRGIDPSACFHEELFLQSHAAVAWAVNEGRADVGASYAVFENGDTSGRLLKSGFGDFVPELRARIVLAAGPIPSDVIVAQRALDADARGRVAAALARIAKEGDRHLRAIMNADDFQPFTESARAELRTLAEAALALGG